jgi:hypothetical protein
MFVSAQRQPMLKLQNGSHQASNFFNFPYRRGLCGFPKAICAFGVALNQKHY